MGATREVSEDGCSNSYGFGQQEENQTIKYASRDPCEGAKGVANNVAIHR